MWNQSEELLDLDLDIHASRQVQPLKAVHRLGRVLDDIHKALVNPHFEVLAGVLVLVRAPDHCVTVLLRGERHRALDLGLGAQDRLDDLLGRLIENLVVIRLQADPDFLGHVSVPSLFFAVLLEDLRNPTGTNGAATFTDGEPKALVHGDGLAQLDDHLGVVTGHHHLST